VKSKFHAYLLCMKLCSINNCSGKHYCRGFCNKHYQRFMRYDGNTDLPPSRSQQLLEQGKSFCPCCDKTKPLSEFGKDQQNLTEIRRYCKDCESEKSKTQYTKHLRRVKSTRLKYRFGISMDDYDKMLTEQNSVCKICKRTPTPGNLLSVDHNHATEHIRGLLCQNCNAGLGMFQDDPEILERAIRYLKGNGVYV